MDLNKRKIELSEASGHIESDDPLVDFLYTLMRDHVPTSVVEKAMNDCTYQKTHFTNGFLALYAINIANELRAPMKKHRSFEDFMDAVEEEARQEGPEAVAQLRAMEKFYQGKAKRARAQKAKSKKKGTRQ